MHSFYETTGANESVIFSDKVWHGRNGIHKNGVEVMPGRGDVIGTSTHKQTFCIQ